MSEASGPIVPAAGERGLVLPFAGLIPLKMIGNMRLVKNRIAVLLLALVALAAAVAVAGCGGSSSASGSSDKISLVAYSTPQEAYEKLIPAFQNTAAGKGISFSQSYGASGD